ncbi:hypothetical protein GTQ34_01385 [Muricauda sp. JGD-17]|uniref:2TM domain-containing protein n=1 Tax=Flagellimonas ochracea TaxID=2696472 RepID=A0A964T976_9FLAO|nr:2TM domain-containing protein [Allomuricauda ochracea]NAY90557.1 hypothetical protein [Allomuricauda ochracea]
MENEIIRLERARKRVGQLKKFYSHIMIYIVVNIALVVLKLHLFESLRDWGNGIEFHEVHWTDRKIISTPLIWGVFLIGHGIWVYSRPLTRRWEERQIKKYMAKEEEEELKRYR